MTRGGLTQADGKGDFRRGGWDGLSGFILSEEERGDVRWRILNFHP